MFDMHVLSFCVTLQRNKIEILGVNTPTGDESNSVVCVCSKRKEKKILNELQKFYPDEVGRCMPSMQCSDTCTHCIHIVVTCLPDIICHSLHMLYTYRVCGTNKICHQKNRVFGQTRSKGYCKCIKSIWSKCIHQERKKILYCF